MGKLHDRISKVKNRKKCIATFFLILGIGIFLPGCNSPENDPKESRSDSGNYIRKEAAPEGFNTSDAYYITGNKRQQEVFRDLFALLKTGTQTGETPFPVVQEIAAEYARQKEYGRLVNFLSSWIHTYPEDPYTAYYFFMIAFAYIQQEAYPVAALYFDFVVKNHPDLIVKGESLHFMALNRLITLVTNPEQLVWYYETLVSRFPDKIDSGHVYFMLGRLYEQIGEWNGAIQAYTQFLSYYGTVIPGFPDAYTYAKQLVDFNNSPKDWTFESLSALLTAIKSALDTGNSVRLWQYRAKVNFFARSWEHEDEDNAGMAEFNLLDFMRGNRIHYAAEVESESNANEAYLRTWGWSQYISVWYFYFRKIYLPPNPEIHGRWEWAGVYYGEKF
jgi:tetratricopeptide (TPR) repeat protein